MVERALEDLRVLNFVTNDRAQFFEAQVAELKRQGVESATLSLPEPTLVDGEKNRSVLDYVRFFPRGLARSFGDFDLLHANYGLMGPFALSQPNLPVVLSLWGSDLLGKYGPVSRVCSRWCDAVVVMSDEMAAELDTECWVIPHGVDLEAFAPRNQGEARAELGWAADVKQVLFPYGPTRPVKDYPRAEAVVDEVRQRVDEPVELKVATGVPHDRMAVYMNAADALLMTSKREGSPNTIKEALACNLPVVSTDVGDVAQRLEGVEPSAVGRTDGELVSGLVAVLERGERSNGRTAVADLSLERMGKRLRSVYAEVLDANPPPARPVRA